jgi:uncharacterized protein YgiM (DUF1202 family)
MWSWSSTFTGAATDPALSFGFMVNEQQSLQRVMSKQFLYSSNEQAIYIAMSSNNKQCKQWAATTSNAAQQQQSLEKETFFSRTRRRTAYLYIKKRLGGGEPPKQHIW